MIAWLNLGSLVLGLIAWILPAINISRYERRSKYWITLSIVSLSACSISLFLQICSFYERVKAEDWSALMESWYQRILMYPLALMLGIASFNSDIMVKKYVIPMAAIGWFISPFDYMQQKITGFAAIKPCTSGVPCNTQYINWFGFITIPFLALTAFTLIIIFMLLIRPQKSVE